MSTRKLFWLDQDERDVINSLSDSVSNDKIIKYAIYHGHNLKNKSFEYDKETGKVVYFETEKES